MKKRLSHNRRIIMALGFSSAISVFLYIARALHYDTTQYWFLNWNLFLAWLPLLFARQLYLRIQKHRWTDWQILSLSALWLVFLPNSFYLSTDFIHLQTASQGNLLYDVVLLLSFSINGFMLGFISLYLIHTTLLKRVKLQYAHLSIAGVLLICSFAIYLGRYLRWNSWDILINPAGLLFDLSDRIINPSAHPQTFVTTLTFFALLGSTYIVFWQIAHTLKSQKH